MPYFVPGGGVSACCHPGVAQTDLFAVNEKGQLCALAVQGAGVWSSPLPLTPTQFALPGTFLVASPDFGAPLPGVALFLVDAGGTLQLFTQAAPRLSWRKQSLSAPGQFAPGSQSFAVLPGTLRGTQIINQINVLIFDEAGTLHWYHRDGDQPWSVNTSFQFGPPAANANIAGLVQYTNSQIAQGLSFFFVDADGKLNRWTDFGSGGWQGGPMPMEGSNLNPGTQLATSPRFGAPSTGLGEANVFAVDVNGNLLCYSLGSSGGWQMTPLTFLPGTSTGVLPFAPPGAPVVASRQYLNHSGPPYQTDVFVVGNDGTLYVFYSQDGKPWSGPIPIAEHAAKPKSALAVASQASFSPPDNPIQTNLFLCDLNQHLNVCYVIDDGPWERLVLPDAFDPDVPMLQGGEQIVFSTGDAFLTDLQVDILVTEDLVPTLQIDTRGNPVGGLSFQLNCNGAPGVASPWEQFTISLSPLTFVGTPGAPGLSAEVQCWTIPGNSVLTERSQPLMSFPVMDTPKIPAGYGLRIVLTAIGTTIVEAQFYVIDPSGNQSYWDAKLLNMTLVGSNNNVTAADLSNVACFQLNIVGGDADQLTQLRSGAGTITYTSTTALAPALIQHTNTGEGSNCIYSTVSPVFSKTFFQHFQILP